MTRYGRPPALADVEDLDHVRMHQPTYYASLSLEVPPQGRIVKALYLQQLHRHRPLEA